MNKKLFLGMFAAAGMLFATSCSNDELNAVQSGDEAQVTFSLGLEGGLATRAISDGTGAKKLVCAIYNANDETNPTLLNQISINNQKVDANGQYVDTEAFDSGLTDNITVTLTKGQKYTIAFWAQNPKSGAYSTDDLKNISISYDGANNDETRDAFYAVETFEVKGNKEIDVTLKRPFAQINVGVYADDWDAAVASGIEIENSSVVIKNAATALNLLTGNATNAEEAIYTLGAIPSEMLKVDTDNDGTKEEYHWLSMSYILVEGNAEQATLESLQFTFDPASGNDIEFKEGLNTVPVRRNWRTNILGKILTGDIQFNITIDPDFDGDYIYPGASSSVQELEFAASFGGTVTLTESVEMPEERPFLQVAADFTLNMEEDVTLTTGDATNYGIIVNSGTTTINGNGDIKSAGGGIGVVDGANVVFNGGNLDINTTSTSGRYLFYLAGEGSTATINGGNFDFNKTQNQKRAYIYAEAGTTVYVKGGTFGKASTRNGYTAGILGEGTVIITGGTFGFDPTTWVAEGYTAIKKDDSYVVVPQIVASLTNVTEQTTTTIENDVTVSTGATIHTQDASADITINGNGNSIISTANSANDFQWEGGNIPAMSTIFSSTNGSTVTVNDLTFEGTMSAVMLGHYQNATYNNYNTVLNNVNVIGTEVVSFSSGLSPAVCVYGTATLNNCNIYGTTLSELDTAPMWPVYDLVAVNYADVKVNGGKIGSTYLYAKSKMTIETGSTVETINCGTYPSDGLLMIKSGAEVETINLVATNGSGKKPAITIKNGANVSTLNITEVVTDYSAINIAEGSVTKIIVNGTEKTLDEFNALKN